MDSSLELESKAESMQLYPTLYLKSIYQILTILDKSIGTYDHGILNTSFPSQLTICHGTEFGTLARPEAVYCNWIILYLYRYLMSEANHLATPQLY